MTTDIETEPVVRWVPGKGLITDYEATPAQESKARRYVSGGHISLAASAGEVHGWGQPTWTMETYVLSPIPGCKHPVQVRVKTWINAAGETTAVDYRCTCQHAAGTVASAASMCSHVLAVRRYRRDA